MRNTTKAKLLLVDDTPANLLALEAVLTSPRYELIQASSGSAAIQACAEQEFALIVLDINMPVLDGFQTAQKIKEMPLNQDAPIIFVTATYQDDPYVKKGYQAGAIDFFGKPFDPEILKTKVSLYTDLYLKTKRLGETETLKSHAQIKALLEAMPVGVIVTNSAGKIYECNEEAKRIWGEEYQADILNLTGHERWRTEEGRPIALDDWSIKRSLRNKEATHHETVRIDTQHGGTKLVSHSALPIFGREGRALGAVFVLQDLTEHAQVADEFSKKARQLLSHAGALPNPPAMKRHVL